MYAGWRKREVGIRDGNGKEKRNLSKEERVERGGCHKKEQTFQIPSRHNKKKQRRKRRKRRKEERPEARPASGDDEVDVCAVRIKPHSLFDFVSLIRDNVCR